MFVEVLVSFKYNDVSSCLGVEQTLSGSLHAELADVSADPGHGELTSAESLVINWDITFCSKFQTIKFEF